MPTIELSPARDDTVLENESFTASFAEHRNNLTELESVLAPLMFTPIAPSSDRVFHVELDVFGMNLWLNIESRGPGTDDYTHGTNTYSMCYSQSPSRDMGEFPSRYSPTDQIDRLAYQALYGQSDRIAGIFEERDDHWNRERVSELFQDTQDTMSWPIERRFTLFGNDFKMEFARDEATIISVNGDTDAEGVYTTGASSTVSLIESVAGAVWNTAGNNNIHGWHQVEVIDATETTEPEESPDDESGTPHFLTGA